MVTQLSQIPQTPELKDVLNAFKREVFLDLNTHAVGKIQSFDPLKQTATVTINYTRASYMNSEAGVYTTTQDKYPVIQDVPVVSLGGGAGALTFPIAKGDDCILIFNDRDIDNWFVGGAGSAPNSLRMHSISDGFALVGVRSLADVIKNFSMARVVLRNGLTARVAVGSNSVSMEIGPSADDLVPGVPTAAVSVTGSLITFTTQLGNIALDVATGKTRIQQQTAGTLGAAMTALTNGLLAMTSTSSSGENNMQAAAVAMQTAATALATAASSAGAPVSALAPGFTQLATACGQLATACGAVGSGFSMANTAFNNVATTFGSLLL